ncbi:hypothetical protein AB6A23_26265 [Paenibacillus tarimensis]
MGFVIIFFATWLAVFGFAAMTKSLSVIENTFIYLVVFIVTVHFSWIVIEELKWIKLAGDPMSYAAYIIYRTFLLPMLYVMLFNMVYNASSRGVALVIAFAILAVTLAVNGVLLFYDVYRYVQWNINLTAITYILLQVLIYYTLKLFRKSTRAGEGTV